MPKILVLGGDGYLGWPTAMRFSALGWQVAVIDNQIKRDLALKFNCEALIPTPGLAERCELFRELTGFGAISCHIGDVTDYGFLSGIMRDFQPDTIIHFAEQPSAPLSMCDYEMGALTLKNNLMSTFNVIHAMKDFCPNSHLIKLGTMGEYGTPDIDIEEGWIDIAHKGRSDRFLFPRQSGSLYHTTKILDTDLMWFYVRNAKLRVTDLMQGPVYGLITSESEVDDRLLPNFHYDEMFGTVLNRFMVQAVAGIPLTVYGSGGQTRGFINICDTLQCLEIAATHPSSPGELQIFNQFTETFSVLDLAKMTKEVGDDLGLQVEIGRKENPRNELELHYYNPAHDALSARGLKPHFLTPEILAGMMNKIKSYKDRIYTDAIFRGVKW